MASKAEVRKGLEDNKDRIIKIIVDDIKEEGPMCQALVDLIARDCARRGPIWATLVRMI
ncbi:MAG: hypothetical protein ACXABY_36595 [Candidatus Thorarchaeota archaeon]|jgi:hypothetical protein